MPGMDGTGPYGTGPVGWGRGPCGRGGARYYGRGAGFGMGWGRGRGYGQGLGFGRWFGYAPSPELETSTLRDEARFLEQELAEIRRRLGELEAGSKNPPSK